MMKKKGKEKTEVSLEDIEVETGAPSGVPEEDGAPTKTPLNASAFQAVLHDLLTNNTSSGGKLITPETASFLSELCDVVKRHNKDCRNGVYTYDFPNFENGKLYEHIKIYTTQVNQPDDRRYDKNPTLVRVLRRGISIVVFADGSVRTVCALRKFFYASVEKLNGELEENPPIYYTRKENGELVRVAMVKSPVSSSVYTFVGSKNMPLLARMDTRDLSGNTMTSGDAANANIFVRDLDETFNVERWRYPNKMARCWFQTWKGLSVPQRKRCMEVLLEGCNVFVGELVGGVDQHFVVYEKSQLIVFAVVPQLNLNASNCLPVEEGKSLVESCGLDYVRSSRVDTVKGLAELCHEVTHGGIQEQGEGAVFYTSKGQCFKFKSLDYTFLRKQRGILSNGAKLILEKGRVDVVDTDGILKNYIHSCKNIDDSDESASLLDGHAAGLRARLHYLQNIAHNDMSSMNGISQYIDHEFLSFTSDVDKNSAQAGEVTCVKDCLVCSGKIVPFSIDETTPFIIGISAPPGSGKTTFLRMVKAELEKPPLNLKVGYISLDAVQLSQVSKAMVWKEFLRRAAAILDKGYTTVIMDMCFSSLSSQDQVIQYMLHEGYGAKFCRVDAEDHDSGVPPSTNILSKRNAMLVMCAARVMDRKPGSHNTSTLVPGTVPPQVCIKAVHEKFSGVLSLDALHSIGMFTSEFEGDGKPTEHVAAAAAAVRKIAGSGEGWTTAIGAQIQEAAQAINKSGHVASPEVMSNRFKSLMLPSLKKVVPKIVERTDRYFYAGVFIGSEGQARIRSRTEALYPGAATVDPLMEELDPSKPNKGKAKQHMDHVTLVWKGGDRPESDLSHTEREIAKHCRKEGNATLTATHLVLATFAPGQSIAFVKCTCEPANNNELAALLEPKQDTMHVTCFTYGETKPIRSNEVLTDFASRGYSPSPWERPGTEFYDLPRAGQKVTHVRIHQLEPPICVDAKLGLFTPQFQEG